MLYTLNDLALRLGIAPQRVRARLRKAGIERTGDKWQWPDRAAFDDVLQRLNGRQPSKPRPIAPASSTSSLDPDSALLDPAFDGE